MNIKKTQDILTLQFIIIMEKTGNKNINWQLYEYINFIISFQCHKTKTKLITYLPYTDKND